MKVHATSKSTTSAASWVFLAAAVLVTARSYGAGPACQPVYASCLNYTQNIYNSCRNNEPASVCSSIQNSLNQQCATSLSNCTEMWVFPKFHVVSILYMPPGNKSTVGYSLGASAGETSSLTQTFTETQAQPLSFSVEGASIGDTLTITNTNTTMTMNQTTNQNTESTTWAASSDPLDHTQDIISVWVNPELVVANFPTNFGLPGYVNGHVISYMLGNSAYDPSTALTLVGDPIAGGDMAVYSVSVAKLQNPTQLLPGELTSKINSDGTTSAGLMSLCANKIPESQCTLAVAQVNACGCTAADFAPIVQQHPFFNPGIATHTVAGINAADPNNARFVPVKDVAGANLEIPLQYGVTQSVNLSDSNNASTTYTHTLTQVDNSTEGFSYKAGSYAGFDFSSSDSMTWTITESSGASNGLTHTQSLVLATTNPNCFEYVNIFEDTVFHTFLFDNGSNAVNPCP